jgi:cytochrome oxidase Cu insertion factor (SCO1/SenC/PrrC family)
MNPDIDFEQYRMGDCSMLVREKNPALIVATVATLLMAGAVAQAQQTAAPATAVAAGPSVNDLAPDFTLSGATRYGLLKTPITLADFRGRTVVLAFFFQARTKG